jgi:CRISPR system Cascade subunit CasC
MHYLNIHTLYSLAYASPNRDDTGSPKTLQYGGVTRARISAQAAKRAKRIGYEYSVDGDRTHRSNLLAERITEIASDIMAQAGRPATETQKEAIKAEAAKRIGTLTKGETAATAAETKTEQDDEPKENQGNRPPEKKDTLVWLDEYEERRLTQEVITRILAAAGTPDQAATFVQPQTTQSLTIAAFGRMFANSPELQTEAAVQMSHAFTTHAAAVDIDYFTAVDDLREHGAGHLGIQQYTGGVFYQYCNVDRAQLLHSWAIAREPVAENRLAEFFAQLLCALPTGRQNNAAHHCLPKAVLMQEARQPISLAAAFDVPVTADHEGLLVPSIKALAQEHNWVRAQTPSWVGRSWATQPDLVTPTLSLEEITKAGAAWVLEGLQDAR